MFLRLQARGITSAFRRVLCHLILLLLKATFLVERYVLIAAVEDSLVTSEAFADTRESLNDSQAELLSLLAVIHGDILNVSHRAQPTQELALNEDGANADNAVRSLVDDNDGEVGVGA